MKTIFKYPLKVADTQVLLLPQGAKPLSVHVQRDQVCMWAEVDQDESRTRKRTVTIVGTGHPFNGSGSGANGEEQVGDFIGTVLLYDGDLVLHVFVL